jgi:hypothetical protein
MWLPRNGAGRRASWDSKKIVSLGFHPIPETQSKLSNAGEYGYVYSTCSVLDVGPHLMILNYKGLIGAKEKFCL